VTAGESEVGTVESPGCAEAGEALPSQRAAARTDAARRERKGRSKDGSGCRDGMGV